MIYIILYSIVIVLTVFTFFMIYKCSKLDFNNSISGYHPIE